jgi:anaerobic C4-dicarboxylate transporter
MVYKICGWMMLICIALMILYFATDPPSLRNMPVVFALETVAVEAFGISWITKGQTLWPDGEHYMRKGLGKVKQRIQQSTQRS